MSLAADQISYRLLCQMLRVALQEWMDSDEAASVACRATAALYTLLLEHRIDRRGRCSSCRPPGTVLGCRRRCRVHRVARYWLHQPDPALVVSNLVSELGLRLPLPPVVRPEPDWPGLTITDRAGQNDTDVLPRIEDEPPDPGGEFSPAPVLLPLLLFPGGGVSWVGWPVSDHGGAGVHLGRYRPTLHTAEGQAHLLPLPLRGTDGQRQVVSALCGRRLHVEHLDTVAPGRGQWCCDCFVAHVTGGPAAPAPTPDPDTPTEIDTVAGRMAAGVAYQRLGWPVTLRRREVALNLDLDADAVAVIIPTLLSFQVAEILTRRHCPPPVLAHPAMPTHRVIIAGERYPVPLGWPTGVFRTTGTLLLPPTVTTRGPVCWVRPPQPDALRLCREVDVATALRTALSDPPPAPDGTDT